jgi:hypothetical protein
MAHILNVVLCLSLIKRRLPEKVWKLFHKENNLFANADIDLNDRIPS